MESVKILLVDADTKASAVVSKQLNDANYETCTVHTAQDALEKLCEEFSPNLILLCLDMAAANNYALLQEIKTIYPQKKIVLASAHKNHEHTTDTTFTGAYTIIPKPVDVTILIESLGLSLVDKVEGAMVAATLAQAGAFEEADETLQEMDMSEELTPTEEASKM